MNILFLSLFNISSIEERNIYTDLLRKFRDNGHSIYIVSPVEKRNSIEKSIIIENHVKIVKIRSGNIQKTGMLEKGISTIMIEKQIKRGIKKKFSNVKFDLVLYPTPPITLLGAVSYVKRRDGARTYLLLKDIFPQNSVDLGILKKTGIKGLIYKYFREKEKKLYRVSDYIGCMSRANVEYILKHNSDLTGKVSICPNCIEVQEKFITLAERNIMRSRYNIPLDKKVFVYGGNLGKPQGINFLIKCLKTQESNESAYFLIIGNGTEYHKLEKYFESNCLNNMQLLKSLPKEEYDSVIAACDVGMIFLDYRFTIPNFPSRLLGYMQAKLPVLVVSDCCTDVGLAVEEGSFGQKCNSNDVDGFIHSIELLLDSNCKELGENAFAYLGKNYSTDIGYKRIMQQLEISKNM